jgi:acyl dehydratase
MAPSGLELEFDRRPSVAAYMLRALAPSPGLERAGGFPPAGARWRGQRVDRRHLAEFLRLTGLPAGGPLPLLYPHVSGFPLLMAILTLRAWPLPIWRSLAVRTHLLQHRPIPEDAVLDLEARTAGQRILEKGAEVDLHTEVRQEGELSWESLVTFYYRGRLGLPGEPSPMARAPQAAGAETATWRADAGGGWRFGGLNGDCNPLHWGTWYARRRGFRRAFHHPPMVLGQCLARLRWPGPAPARRLDAWLRGPVYHGSQLRLSSAAEPDGDGVTFALRVDEEPRPALLGRLHAAPPAPGLLDDLPGGGPS